MKRKPVSLVLVFTFSMLAIAGLMLGVSFHSDWSEQHRIGELTEKHGDELLVAVEKYRLVLAMGLHVDNAKLHLYTTGPALRRLQAHWDDMQMGENIVSLTSLDYDSVQVLSCTKTTASLLARVRWKQAVDGRGGLELEGHNISGAWVRYTLLLEDDHWKVADLDACTDGYKLCLRELRVE